MRSTAQLPTGNFRFQFHHSARVSRILHSGMKAVWFFSACVFFFPATANSFGFTSGWVTSGLGNSARASTSPGLSRADTAARRRLHAGVSRHYRQQRINVLSTKALRDPKEEGEDETLDILPELRRSGKLNERGADEEVSEVDGAFQTSLSSLFRPQAVAPKEAASRLKKPPLPFSQNIKDLLRRSSQHPPLFHCKITCKPPSFLSSSGQKCGHLSLISGRSLHCFPASSSPRSPSHGTRLYGGHCSGTDNVQE